MFQEAELVSETSEILQHIHPPSPIPNDWTDINDIFRYLGLRPKRKYVKSQRFTLEKRSRPKRQYRRSYRHCKGFFSRALKEFFAGLVDTYDQRWDIEREIIEHYCAVLQKLFRTVPSVNSSVHLPENFGQDEYCLPITPSVHEYATTTTTTPMAMDNDDLFATLNRIYPVESSSMSVVEDLPPSVVRPKIVLAHHRITCSTNNK